MAVKPKAIYQYETSPRKLEPEYKPNKSNKPNKPSKKKQAPKVNKPNNPNNDKSQNKSHSPKTDLQIKKEKELKDFTMKFKLIIYMLILFAAFFIITFRNSQIDESFMKVKSLQADLALLQKENEQLKVGIENSFNLSNVEQQAKELLGMQKLDDFQKEYINLPKNDFVESANEKIIIEEDNWFKKIIKIITNLW